MSTIYHPAWCAADRDDDEWMTHVSKVLETSGGSLTGWLEQADDEDAARIQVLAVGSRLSNSANDLEDLSADVARAVAAILLDLAALATGSES